MSRAVFGRSRSTRPIRKRRLSVPWRRRSHPLSDNAGDQFPVQLVPAVRSEDAEGVPADEEAGLVGGLAGRLLGGQLHQGASATPDRQQLDAERRLRQPEGAGQSRGSDV